MTDKMLSVARRKEEKKEVRSLGEVIGKGDDGLALKKLGKYEKGRLLRKQNISRLTKLEVDPNFGFKPRQVKACCVMLNDSS